MKIRHLFLSFVFLVTVSLLGGCAGPASDSPERCYKDGQEALAAESAHLTREQKEWVDEYFRKLTEE